MASQTQSKNSRTLYWLLAVYIVASMTYLVAVNAAVIDNWFNLHHRPQTPFQFDPDTLKITSLRPEAAKAGLAKDDTLIAVNGTSYAGLASWYRPLHADLHPGDTLHVTMRTAAGTEKKANIILTGQTGAAPFKIWGPQLILFGVVPLICLLIGYWVVLARPRDFNAWLILWLLTFPEVLNVSPNWWQGPWLILSGVWFMVQQITGPLALLLIGLYFPERWRWDRRLPWAKWLLLAPPIISLGLILWLEYGEYYRPAWNHWSILLGPWISNIVNPINLLCVLLYWVAIFDKMNSAESADSRRRLQVLCAGSVVGLGSLLIIFVLLPHFHIVPQTKPWLAYIGLTLSLVFPFTLAYVVIVQRAMDVQILLRMGTKYALARATLTVVRTGVLTGLIVLLVAALRSPSLTLRSAVEIAILAGLLLLLRSRFTKNLSSWLDRKFFREAYNSEQLLAELSHRVRKYSESGPMLEMVLKSLAETLHIQNIAVLLRGGNNFQLQQAVGINIDGFSGGGSVQLPMNSATVRNLMRINTPVQLYRENPDGWLLLASSSERELLDSMSVELLLPLPGREQLMGLMTLGPKRSEEPYTPTDLRLLESVATQTGLALEIGNLARSLASEATQRERIHREIEVAREVQERLFPQEFPAIDGVSLAGHCRPQQGVGGDYYDSFLLDDGRMALAIGDVSGKGISAALLMASLRASLRGMTLDAPHDLATMMEKVNRLVYEASASNRYATFFFATYNMHTRELIYVNAGHNAPFLLRRDGSHVQVERLEAGGPVIGLLAFAKYEEQRCVLQPGDLLLAYTDGISEAMTEHEEEWGEDRMLLAAESLPDGTAQQVLQHLFAEADRFTGNAPQFDDMTLLVLKLQDPAKPANPQQIENSV
ncbi:MAG TPA: SpoIIE family protein phosphatase [Acidobacteriaceae bacterium]|nr:SpoIIE family protein phosphatase [Acidobacteriaceae bacterium]